LRLDGECQEQAEAVIRRRFPGHDVLGEEDPSGAARGECAGTQWIIDPIDGTVNFSHGLPAWCCSVAVAVNGKVAAGAVYAPATNECFTAATGHPARLNGRIIHVSRTRCVARALVLTGLDKSVDPRRPSFEIFRRLSASAQKARVMGSAALDICRVACGQADGYFESGIYLWDVAAAGLVVRQAGGRAEILRRLDNGRLQFLASNGRIHRALRRLVGS
jgi:myo-inositol-1(or 4)-monophosphatase